jgi:hypothetical protein
MPCPFASALGIPHKGFHEERIGDFAYNDVIGTFGLAGITTLLFKIDLRKTIIGWFVLGEIMHYIFGVNTAFLQKVNLSPECSTENGPDETSEDSSVN